METKRRKRKHPRMPNGYGTIKYLGKNRRNPYGVYPPVTEWHDNGSPILPPALAYVDDWYKGFAILTSYKAGTYRPGMADELEIDLNNLEAFTRAILADYSRIRTGACASVITFKEVYDRYYEDKYVNTPKKFSKSSMTSTRVAFNNCSALHDREFASLRYADLQRVVDECPLKHASLELIINLFHGMYDYAIRYEIVENDYSQKVRINIEDDVEHGDPFTEDDLRVFANDADTNETARSLLIMCYSGFRIAAYYGLEINLEEQYFKGGVKTKNSKGRIVPIHPGISRYIDGSPIIKDTKIRFRENMYSYLQSRGIKKHTPHDCRHTFSMLCERYGVNENDRKRLLGHSFDDVTNSVYGHRSVEDLRKEMEKITFCC